MNLESNLGIYTIEYWIDSEFLYHDQIAKSPSEALELAKKKIVKGNRFKII